MQFLKSKPGSLVLGSIFAALSMGSTATCQNISVTSTPDGAQFYLDGKSICATPCSVGTNSNMRHTVETKKPGYDSGYAYTYLANADKSLDFRMVRSSSRACGNDLCETTLKDVAYATDTTNFTFEGLNVSVTPVTTYEATVCVGEAALAPVCETLEGTGVINGLAVQYVGPVHDYSSNYFLRFALGETAECPQDCLPIFFSDYQPNFCRNPAGCPADPTMGLPNSQVTFDSNEPGTAVAVDNVFRGNTPITLSLSMKAYHTYEFRKTGFESTGGRMYAHLPTDKVHGDMIAVSATRACGNGTCEATLQNIAPGAFVMFESRAVSVTDRTYCGGTAEVCVSELNPVDPTHPAHNQCTVVPFYSAEIINGIAVHYSDYTSGAGCTVGLALGETQDTCEEDCFYGSY